MIRSLLVATRLLLVLTLATGVLYPLAVTGIAQVVWPWQASGSILVDQSGVARASALVGQHFEGDQWFWSRPSATGGMPYNAAASGGSNLSTASPRQLELLAKRRAQLAPTAGPGESRAIPVDLLTASASGLDPHISVDAALFQVPRVAAARGRSTSDLEALIARHTEGRWLGLFGEPRVAVVTLNAELDGLALAPESR
jgi:K+-transporting ATPase ATPase C chain